MRRGLKHLATSVALLITVGAAGALDVTRADADQPHGPQLTSVSAASVGTAGPDQTVSWTLDTGGDSQPIVGATMTFTLDGADAHDETPPSVTASFTGSSQTDSSGHASVVVTGSTGHYQAAGHYSLGHVYLGDASGASTDYLRDASKDGSTEAATNNDDGPSLRPADFDLTNSRGDGTAPVIGHISLRTAAVVLPGDPLVIAYSASDDSSGVTAVSGSYDQAGDGELTIAAVPGSESAGPLTASIPGFGNNGVWELASLTVTDRAGNARVYRRGDPSLDLSAADLSVSGVTPDTKAPLLTSLTSAAAPTAPGGWLGFGYTSSDDASGVANVRGFYSDPNGHFGAGYVGNVCADPTQGVAGATDTAATQTGTWTLQQVIVFDHLDHQTVYDRNGSVREIPADPSAAPPSPVDLSAGDVSITNAAKYQSEPTTPCAPGTALTASTAGADVIGTVTHAGVPVIDPVIGTYAATSNGLLLTSLTTGDSAGRFTAPPLPTGSVRVFLHFFGGRDRTGKTAQPIDATPTSTPKLGTARVSIKSAHVGVKKLRRVKLSVTVMPANRGDVVLVQKPHGRSWMTIARGRLNAQRRSSFTLAFPRAKLRFYVPATSTHTATAAAIKPALLR